MLSRIIKIVILVGLVGFLSYAGMCVYANFFSGPSVVTNPEPPPATKAAYALLIKNTGNVLYSNDVEQNGEVYILHGHWEEVDGKFKYRTGDIMLDERLFGPITLRRR